MDSQPPPPKQSDDLPFDRTETELHGELSVRTRQDDERSSDASSRRSVSVSFRGGLAAKLQDIEESDRYTFAGEHARGGLGRVVRAYDQRLERTVAVKELLAQSELAESLFVREALITARLQHPGIVPVHDAGRWPSGEPFYVMKLVSGKSLKDLITETRSLQERLALLTTMIAVAETVAYAHSEGVLHRDIKPANVLSGDFGETVVVDWGLASDRRRGIDSSGMRATDAVVEAELGTTLDDAMTSSSAEHTVSGKVIGTPAYMSPEQARGDEVDTRTDIYALGAVLYEILAGVPPYDGSSARETLEKVLAGPPVPLDERQPGVPPELVTIVGKAMARDADERYASAKQLADELRRFATGQLVSAHHYSTATLLKRWLWRHRSPVAVAAAGLIMMATMAVLGIDRIIGERNQARSERAQAQEAQQKAEERQKQLTILQATNMLYRDPTTTLAWLKQAALDEQSLPALRAMYDEAVGMGVARHVLMHDDWVLRVVFSPDGRWLASGGYDRAVRLWHVETGAVRVLGRHDDVLSQVMFSPDGGLLATSDRQRVTRIWHVASGNARTLPASLAQMTPHGFTRDGTSLVMASADGRSYRRWNLLTGAVVALAVPAKSSRIPPLMRDDGSAVALHLGGPLVALVDPNDPRGGELRRFVLPAAPSEMSFGGTSRYLLVRTEGGALHVIDTETGALDTLGSLPRPWEFAVISPSARFVAASIFDDPHIYLWDRRAPDQARGHHVLMGHEDHVFNFSFAADDSVMASAGDDAVARIWDLKTLKATVLRGHADDVFCAALGPGGKLVATCSLDGSARLWEVPRETIFHAASELPGVPFAVDQQTMLTAAYGADIQLWNLRTGEARLVGRVPGPFQLRFDFPAVSPDRTWVAARVAPGEIGLWHVPTGAYRAIPVVPPEARASVKQGIGMLLFAPDGKSLAMIGPDDRVMLWNTETSEAQVLRGGERPNRIAFSPDGRNLAMALHRKVEIWDLPSRQVASEIALPEDLNPDRRILYSPDGRWLLVAMINGTHVLRDNVNGSTRTFHLVHATMPYVVFSPDSSEVAISRADRAIVIVPTAGGEPRVLRGHGDVVYSMAYSPDGRYLASASHDRTVRLWDARTGQARIFYGHGSAVHGVAFMASGNQLVSTSLDGTIRVWDSSRDPIASADDLGALLEATTSAVVLPGDRVGTPGP